jgi:CubicO group peptidase (beta-lactamase class C family)
MEILDAVFSGELRSPPGEHFAYSNATSILLGLTVERVAGAPLDMLANERLFAPLAMNRTTFHPETLDSKKTVPTEIDPWRGREIRGETHDETGWKLREIMVPGSAGLFSTVPDLLNFVEMILGGGVWNGKRLLSAPIIERMHTNQLGPIGESAGLGWELNQPRFMGKHAHQVIGKTGFTGCVMMCDVKQGKGFVHLSNWVFPRRRAEAEAINRVRRELAHHLFALC